jgi:hypothetical protein
LLKAPSGAVYRTGALLRGRHKNDTPKALVLWAFILTALASVNQALNNVRPLSTNGFESRLTVAAHFGEYELSIGKETSKS